MTAVAARQSHTWLAPLLAGSIDLAPALDREVRGLALDSRGVNPGDVFFARSGTRVDGARFIPDAVAAGAVAVVREGRSAGAIERAGVLEVRVADVDQALGQAAARFHGEPARYLRMIGVTGTNGKTSVCHLVAQALEPEGRRCALIGTLGAGFANQLSRPGLTTPDALTLHAALADLRAAGARTVMLEVSSHALAQRRVAGTPFTGAVFTNLSRDHLDYHADVAAYGNAKQRLFERPELHWVVVNVDDRFGRELAAVPHPAVRRWRVSLAGERTAEVRGRILEQGRGGLRIAVNVGASEHGELVSSLLGEANAANLLSALAVLLATGVRLGEALARLGRATAPAGRLECHRRPGSPLVVVDFAHTPDALSRSLATLRGVGDGRLWCVFGCGGERDRGKRPLMGAAAAALADEVVVTDDNPRAEDPERIVAEILAGVPTGARVRVERDRATAIALALSVAAAEDVVLVAGKGHEGVQEIAGVRRPFSDSATVRRLLAEDRP